jgi:hypothetical protein
MAVNQAQVDHIISTASADDPEVRLLKLQDEVDLLKTSIKRLLIDIRERMNDLDNPFNVTSIGVSQDTLLNKAPVLKEASDAVTSAAGALKSTSGMKDTEHQAETELHPTAGPYTESVQGNMPPAGPNSVSGKIPDDDLMRVIKSRLSGLPDARESSLTASSGIIDGKVRLQKVFRLFEWTTKNVRQYGHDRVDLMLESFRAMGYITSDSCALVKDIARLMPNTLGEQHEIHAKEYVTELYELNHILNPGDLSLDRDMIEVFMQRHASGDPNQKAVSLESVVDEMPSPDLARKKDRI